MNQEKAMQVVKNILEYSDRHNLYVDYYSGCVEPGYADKPIIAADWNPTSFKFEDKGLKHNRTSKLGTLVERLDQEGYITQEWSDEWASCSECGKAFRTTPDSYAWEPYYIMGDGKITCGDCVLKDPEPYLEGYMNDTRHAIPSWLIESANNCEFHCALEDETFKDACKYYETGFHRGQNDTPEKALKDLYELVSREWFESHMDYIFAITGKSQFDISWICLVRPKAYQA